MLVKLTAAFQFDQVSGSCDLGSKANLLIPQPNDLSQELTKITINTAGKAKMLLNIKITICIGKPN